MRHPDMLEVGNGMTENEDRDGLQFWFKPLAGGDWAFTILNPTRQDISCCLNWQDFNPLPPFFREDTYLAREVYLLRNISSIG